MHRLPELLVGLVALLVLCGLIFFAFSGLFEQKPPTSTVVEPQEVAALAPLHLPPLPPLSAPSGIMRTVLKPPQFIFPGKQPMIALVIDDCGIAEAATRAAIALPPEVTMTFLPYGTKSAALARQASAAGHDILLHMPMQPEGSADPGPEALTVDLSAAEITRRLREGFANLPSVIGMNNHMGSRFTSDATAMAPVIEEMRRRNLLFLDSVTSAKSVAAAAAREAGIPTLSRDVFLDDTVTEAEVERQLARAEALARKHGSAIAIGHPHSSTIKVLHRWLADYRQRGFQIVSLQTLMALRTAH
ncbi:MAG: divergent polysaccharide deacetylase family protein [Alphaproteobacteria bacterium]|nr:divergent polysaccharide deacetylase family protein [Alphaproteobacteria bacterium]